MNDTQSTHQAVTVREIQLSELGTVHGVTCDNDGHVWFAEGDGDLYCVEPGSGRVVKRFEGLGAQAGTAFDGTHIWQLTPTEILRVDPESGEVIRRLPAPDVHCSGMAWAEGSLWIGDFDGKGLVQIDAETGEVRKRLQTDRFVTGVAFLGDELWHGSWDGGDKPERPALRRIDGESGEVLEDLELPADLGVSGLAVDGEGRFWCGGGYAGGLHAVRRGS